MRRRDFMKVVELSSLAVTFAACSGTTESNDKHYYMLNMLERLWYGDNGIMVKAQELGIVIIDEYYLTEHYHHIQMPLLSIKVLVYATQEMIDELGVSNSELRTEFERKSVSYMKQYCLDHDMGHAEA